MAELIPFVVPAQSDKVLLVWELSAGPPAEALSRSLLTAFSRFGLVYSVRVFPNAAVAGPGFYAVLRFYSSRDARRAQKACDGEPLFQTSPVKVGADAGVWSGVPSSAVSQLAPGKPPFRVTANPPSSVRASLRAHLFHRLF